MFVPNFKLLGIAVPEKSLTKISIFITLDREIETSSPKGNDAHLRVIIQSEKKWKHQFFRRLRAANSVVGGRI